MPASHPLFRGDPLTGEGQIIYEDGRTYDATVEDFTQGRFMVQGYQLVRSDNPFDRLSIGRQGPFTLTKYGTDVYNIVSQTLKGESNSVVGSDAYRMASGTVSIMTPTGLPINVDFEGVVTASPSYQWGVYQQETGIDRLVRVPAQYTSSAELQNDYGAGYRLATPDEVILNAAAWATTEELSKIVRDQWEELRGGFGDLSLFEDNFPDTVDDYELVQSVLLAIGSLDNLTVYNNRLFS